MNSSTQPPTLVYMQQLSNLLKIVISFSLCSKHSSSRSGAADDHLRPLLLIQCDIFQESIQGRIFRTIMYLSRYTRAARERDACNRIPLQHSPLSIAAHQNPSDPLLTTFLLKCRPGTELRTGYARESIVKY